ncbi:MAG: glutaredoxin [Candidatus Heimdallarchaeota archaeon]|nr:glutaredoxin [Candidatus Heimdallarchaeota archaeon]
MEVYRVPVTIDVSVKEAVKTRFSNMDNPVTIKVFSTKDHCLMCNEMITMMESVAELSDKIKLETCNCSPEAKKAKEYGIKRHPALAIEGDKDYGIRFFGIPAGKEFTSLIETIMMVSTREAGLSNDSLKLLKKLKKKVNIKVFVTLECPYCPAMVLLGQKIAFASDMVTTEMIEATQFTELAAKYNVFGVPNTIINEQTRVEGLIPEKVLVEKILEAATKGPDPGII